MPATLELALTFDHFYETKAKTVDAMLTYGGSFAKGIALALKHADRSNARIIYNDFAHIYADCAPGGKFHPA